MNSNTMLNRNDKTGHLCLVFELREKTFRTSSFSIVCGGLVIVAFNMLRYIYSIHDFLKISIMMLNFIQCFSFCIY